MRRARLSPIAPTEESDDAGRQDLLRTQDDEYRRADTDGVSGHEDGGRQPEHERPLAQPGRATLSDEMGDLRQVGVSSEGRTGQPDQLGEAHFLSSRVLASRLGLGAAVALLILGAPVLLTTIYFTPPLSALDRNSDHVFGRAQAAAR